MKIIYILLTTLVLAAACTKKEETSVIPEAEKKPLATEMPNKKNVDAKAFLNAASFEPAYKVSQYLRDGADMNVKNENGQTPLELALIYNKDPQVTQLLIGMGADTKIIDPKTGANLLIATAGAADNEQKIKALIKAGLDPNATDNNGITAMIRAATTNTSVGVFLELITAGADINAQNKDGWRPLDYAVRFNRNPDVIKVLLKYGAHSESRAKAKELADLIKTNPYLANKGLEKQIAAAI